MRNLEEMKAEAFDKTILANQKPRQHHPSAYGSMAVVIILSNYTFAALNIWSSRKRILLPINVTNISLWEKRIHAMILLFSESWQSFCHTKSFLQIWPKTSGIIERKYTTNRFSHGLFEERIDPMDNP